MAPPMGVPPVDDGAIAPLPPRLSERHADVVRYLDALETEERTRSLPRMAERAPPLEYGEYAAATGREEPEEEEAKSGIGGGGGAEQSATVGTEDGGDFRPAAAVESAGPAVSDVVVVGAEGGRSPPPLRASLERRDLRAFSLSLLGPGPDLVPLLSGLRVLNVGNNELSDLPGLSSMPNLESLVLTRNWFGKLPSEIGSLRLLRSVDASRNFLRPNEDSLRFSDLRSLPYLRELDLSYNQKCAKDIHVNRILGEVPNLSADKGGTLRVTLWEKVSSAPGSYVGSSAAVRDASLLRSQLEPLGTVRLRRRLVSDFGESPTDPAAVDRAETMRRLLDRYRGEGLVDDGGRAKRRIVRVRGAPVRPELLRELLEELRSWRGDRRRGGSAQHRERPSVDAACYTILRAPDANDWKLEGQIPKEGGRASRRAERTAKKLARNRRLWDLAHEAVRERDPDFAARCTEMAVTYGFRGSPHIDKQNCGPFYGLALGDFADGTGGVAVECSARVVAVVDTKNRLGRIDGRHPHWVAPYDDETEERFSLIYYETGGRFVAPGPAIFSIPLEDESGPCLS